MNLLILDQSRAAYLRDWASEQGFEILSASAPDSEFKQRYAADMGGLVVPDPRGGHAGKVLVVRPLTPTAHPSNH